MKINYAKTELQNGLRILTAPMHETQAVAILILVGVGSRYETEKEAGLSHFLEHMFFKGTKKRPTYLHVSKELDALGSNFNAFTSEEQTGFYVQTSSDHFANAMDVLSDMLLNGTLPEAEVLKERGVITEELNMYLDIPQAHVMELAKRAVFGKNELGRPIIGYKETINATTRAMLADYKHRFYQPGAMVVAIAGAGHQKQWIRAVQDYFGELPNNERPTYHVFEKYQTEPQLTLGSRKTDQAHFVMALPALSHSDENRFTLKVANNILGGMMSSRLFDEIREKRGLAYYVNSGSDEFHETGVFAIRAGVPVGKIEDALAVAGHELEKLATTKVTIEELKRAKENLRGRTYLDLEDSLSVATFLADQELFNGAIEQPEDIIKKVEKVAASDILKVAQTLVSKSLLNLAIVGPYEDEAPFKKILNA